MIQLPKKTGILAVIATVVILVIMPASADAQDSIQVSGVVKTANNQPIANVALSIEGSSAIPVVTGESGEFSFKAGSADSWIIVSPTTEYKNKRLHLDGRNRLEIFLTPSDLPSGEDQVILLNQSMPRKVVPYSIAEVNTGRIHHHGVMSIDQFFAGRVPGMQITNVSGMPASGSVSMLRGIRSINASNQPIIVVDGIPVFTQDLMNSNIDGHLYNPLMELNLHDISKAYVVKDPVIASAYGSRGSNGVIFLETIQPSATQTSIVVDYRNGFSLAQQQHIPQLNASQHRTLISELLFSSEWVEEEITEIYPNLFLTEEDDGYINYQHDTWWQDYIFNDAWYTNFNINVKGGDNIARYGLSFGYTDANGIIKNTDYSGYNLRFVSLLNIFTWLKMDARVALNYNTSNLREAATVDETSPIRTSLAKSPMLNPFQYDLDGNELITTLAEVDELGVSNPLATVNNYQGTNSNYNFVTTLGLTGSISRNLFVKSNFSIGYNVLKELEFMPNKGMELYYNDEAHNVSHATNNTMNSFYNNTYLSYSKQFGPNHKLTSNTGVNIQTNRYQLDWGLTKNAHENDQYPNLQDGLNEHREIGGDNRTWNWMSFYEYLTYSFKEKYIATASVSLDGSSRVGDNAANAIFLGNTPFGLFYSAGGAWRVSSESFMQDLSWLEELRIRATAGISGNDDVGEASSTNYYEAVKFRETVGLYPATVPNPELTYEKVTLLNGGIDFATAGNRFRLQLDYFMSTTDDMIIYRPIDSYLGYDTRVENGGKMENKGWEVSTQVRIIRKGSFKWDLMANLASVKNQVTELPGEKLSYEILGAEKINMVGETANSFYGYLFDGVYSTQAEAEEAGLVNDKGVPYGAGDAIYRDISGPDGFPDSVINRFDKTTLGSPLPDLFGGLINTFSYRRLSLSVALKFVSGNEIFNYVRYKNERMSTLDNQSTSTLNRWQFEGQDTEVPRALYGDPIGNSAFSSRWIEDGSFVRVQNITLAYRIPNEFAAFKNAEFYISANNIFTFSNYLGYDPEFAFSHNHRLRGIDYGQMPNPRQFIAGIKLGL